MFARHPPYKVFGPGLRMPTDQIRKNFLWTVDKELILRQVRLVERLGQCQRLRLILHLVGGIPVRHPSILGVEHDVAALFAVELSNELAGWVINEGTLVSFLHAKGELTNDTCFA